MQAEFITSATGPAGFPRDRCRELALAGRSNVGKSSVINALVRQQVARTSAAPGKTRLANFYRVVRDLAPPFYFVDLPGYGYARGGDVARRELGAIASAYFESRQPGAGGETPGVEADEESGPVPVLAGVLLLVDSRHPGLEADAHAWAWLGHRHAGRAVVATKLDKLTRTERVRHLKELERLHDGPVLGVSAQTGEGLKELWKTIDTMLRPRAAETLPPPLPSR